MKFCSISISWLTCLFVAAVSFADTYEPAVLGLGGGDDDPGPRAAPASTCSTAASALCGAAPADVPTLCSLWQLSAKEKGERLIKAATAGRVQEVQLLLAAGADVRARDSKQNTALHWAAWEGYPEVASCLLSAGAEADADNWVQNKPLHWAVWAGRPAVVRLLAAASADVNARNVDNDTPLHFAAEHGRLDVARALLDSGALREPLNNKDKTPADRARQFNHQHWIDTLNL